MEKEPIEISLSEAVEKLTLKFEDDMRLAFKNNPLHERGKLYYVISQAIAVDWLAKGISFDMYTQAESFEDVAANRINEIRKLANELARNGDTIMKGVENDSGRT